MHDSETRFLSRALGLLCVSLFLGAVNTQADVRLPALIGDNMVLQQEAKAPLWGWAEPGEQITIRADWLDTDITATAGDNGRWIVRVAAPDAGGPHEIRVAAKNEIVIKNVMIGEVWVCSGQSNMWWPVNQSANAEVEIAAADFPDIRMFTVRQTIAAAPEEDCVGGWEVCNAQNVPHFSAVGYYYARDLHRDLKVPLGMIHTSWGGTPAEAWSTRETLNGFDDFSEALSIVDWARDDPEGLERARQEDVSGWWEELEKRDPGSGQGQWQAADLDDSGWDQMVQPGPWEAPDVKDFDGVVWLRKTFEIPTAWEAEDLVLELGPIDDMDTTWFNGKKVGGMEDVGYSRTPRRYTVPSSDVEAGENTIAVRVLDIGWSGGFMGEPDQMMLSPTGTGHGAPIALAGAWRYRAGVRFGDLPPWPRSKKLTNGSPTVLYNGMVAPLVPYAIRGAIWYQGEANRSRPQEYRRLFPAMIEGWRQAWGQGSFPFYFVQIAPFGYAGDTGQAAELREAQAMALSLPNTGMVVTMDIGNPGDIHPRNKQEVGRRLSLWALAKTYGREALQYSGPVYRSMKIEGDSIRVFFDHAEGGLTASPGELTHFIISGEDRGFRRADATIDGETVVVSSSELESPVAVRYAWSAAPEPNLFNAEGFPAAPFRTDDWDYTLADAKSRDEGKPPR